MYTAEMIRRWVLTAALILIAALMLLWTIEVHYVLARLDEAMQSVPMFGGSTTGTQQPPMVTIDDCPSSPAFIPPCDVW